MKLKRKEKINKRNVEPTFTREWFTKCVIRRDICPGVIFTFALFRLHRRVMLTKISETGATHRSFVALKKESGQIHQSATTVNCEFNELTFLFIVPAYAILSSIEISALARRGVDCGTLDFMFLFPLMMSPLIWSGTDGMHDQG